MTTINIIVLPKQTRRNKRISIYYLSIESGCSNIIITQFYNTRT